MMRIEDTQDTGMSARIAPDKHGLPYKGVIFRIISAENHGNFTNWFHEDGILYKKEYNNVNITLYPARPSL